MTATMTAIEAIMTRYSCRAFQGKPVPRADIETIALAAAASPSGVNRQHWRIIAVTNPALLAELEAEGMKNLALLPDKALYERIMSRGGKLYYGTPCMFVIPVKSAEPNKAELFDCGIVSQNIALAATSLGLDSLICGLAALSFAGDKKACFEEKLGFPEGYEIGIAVLVGYAASPGGAPHVPDLDKISYVE